MSVTSAKSSNSFFISSHAPCYRTHFCHPRPTGQLPINGLEKPRRLASKKYFYQTHVTKHESHRMYNTGDSSDDLVGGPAVRKYNDKNKMKDYCKKIKCTRTNNSYSNEHDQALCAFWYLLSEYLKKMFQFYWGFLTIRCPIRRNVRLRELSCEMRGILFCMKKDFGLFFKNALCLPAKTKKKEKIPKTKSKQLSEKKIEKQLEKELKRRERLEKQKEKLEKKEKAKRDKHEKKYSSGSKSPSRKCSRKPSKNELTTVASTIISNAKSPNSTPPPEVRRVDSNTATKTDCSSN